MKFMTKWMLDTEELLREGHDYHLVGNRERMRYGQGRKKTVIGKIMENDEVCILLD